MAWRQGCQTGIAATAQPQPQPADRPLLVIFARWHRVPAPAINLQGPPEYDRIQTITPASPVAHGQPASRGNTRRA